MPLRREHRSAGFGYTDGLPREHLRDAVWNGIRRTVDETSRYEAPMRIMIPRGQRFWSALMKRAQNGVRGKERPSRSSASDFATKLISVHFPKAAGSSLVRAYETAFGCERVLTDYDNSDPMDPCGAMYLDPERYDKMKPTSLDYHLVVHGHFHIGRYDRISNARRVVVLREPVENLISIYYYWSFLHHKGRRYESHCLYRYFCKTRPSLLEFAAIPSVRYLMSNVYFRNVDMACFDLIGDFSDVDGHLRRLAILLGIEFGPMPRVNVTMLSNERSAITEDSHTLARLRDLLADDLRFYERYGRR
jgi:hypothetical protein